MKQKCTRIVMMLLTLGMCLMFGLPVAAAAATATAKSSSSGTTANEDITQAVTQSYNAAAAVQVGMIVRLELKDPTTVEPLPSSNISAMLGITVPAADAAITLTPQNNTEQQVFVATAGRYDMLVSNEGGSISTGDYITISSLAGIGMKASENQTIVLGKAAGSFNGTNNVVSKVKNSQGKTTEVTIGEVPIDLDIAHNPLASKETDYVPSFLAQTATTVANHPVSAARIYLGGLVLIASAVLTGNLLYSGVRNGMQAIGRNPLSRKSIIRSLIQTIIAGLLIFVVGIFAVYLLLKL
jgi:hypothetical protein